MLIITSVASAALADTFPQSLRSPEIQASNLTVSRARIWANFPVLNWKDRSPFNSPNCTIICEFLSTAKQCRSLDHQMTINSNTIR